MSRKTMLKNLIGALACALVTLPTPAAEPLKVGFVYVSPIGQAGWTYQHDQARRAMEKSLGAKVQTRFVEAVPEGADAERVMREMAADGTKLIFATSFGYLEPALRVAADFKGVAFEHAGGYKTAANLNTYNARFYEGRWLAGWLAGKSSPSGVAGYVAGFPLPEVIQGINAFALGMRAANPNATVRVAWLGTWFDPPKEREAALALIGGGADVLANHSGSPAVPQTAQERGVKVIGYQSDMSRFAPDAQLAAVTSDWSGYYTRVAQAVAAGTWQPQPMWGGMKNGMVRLSRASRHWWRARPARSSAAWSIRMAACARSAARSAMMRLRRWIGSCKVSLATCRSDPPPKRLRRLPFKGATRAAWQSQIRGVCWTIAGAQ
jgi:basic membrane protein A and related proteins